MARKPRTQRGKIRANDPHSIMDIDAVMERFGPPTQAHGKPPSIGARGSKPTPKKKVLRKKVLRKKVASSRVRQSQRERGKRKLEQRRAEGRAR